MYKYTLLSEQVVTFFVALALIQLGFNIVRNAPADLSFFLAIIIGLLLKPNINFCVKFVAIVNVITIIIMVYELQSSSYLIGQANSEFVFGRLQGLFSYSKQAGYYAIAATFYLFTVRRFTSLNMFTLISIAILSGTRTAILFIIAVLIIQAFTKIKIRIAKSKLRKFILNALISTSLGYIAINYYFIDDTAYMLDRIYNSFNYTSSSHLDRLFFGILILKG